MLWDVSESSFLPSNGAGRGLPRWSKDDESDRFERDVPDELDGRELMDGFESYLVGVSGEREVEDGEEDPDVEDLVYDEDDLDVDGEAFTAPVKSIRAARPPNFEREFEIPLRSPEKGLFFAIIDSTYKRRDSISTSYSFRCPDSPGAAQLEFIDLSDLKY